MIEISIDRKKLRKVKSSATKVSAVFKIKMPFFAIVHSADPALGRAKNSKVAYKSFLLDTTFYMGHSNKHASTWNEPPRSLAQCAFEKIQLSYATTAHAVHFPWQ